MLTRLILQSGDKNWEQCKAVYISVKEKFGCVERDCRLLSLITGRREQEFIRLATHPKSSKGLDHGGHQILFLVEEITSLRTRVQAV